MSHNHRKRKHKPLGGSAYRNQQSAEPAAEAEQFLAHHQGYQSQSHSWQEASSGSGVGTSDLGTVEPLRALFIQAHEADIVHGDAARAAAGSLEVVEYREVLTASGTREIAVLPRIGSALIQWGDSTRPPRMKDDAGDEEVTTDPELPVVGIESEPAIWVDRYDARLLLNALPARHATSTSAATASTIHRPASPSGWSDIASDAEDTFFFTPDEAEDYHREKRRRLLEQSREDRLRARMQEDGVDDKAEEDIWGGSDEEPDETQSELMARTAIHLLSSPNPAQLEMRILANHGGDRRFAFLRGRWKTAWNLAKAKARLKKKAEEEAEKPPTLSNALAGYGSGSDSDADADDEHDKPPEPVEPAVVVTEPPAPEEVSAQELRRQKLKKWQEERRVSQLQKQNAED